MAEVISSDQRATYNAEAAEALEKIYRAARDGHPHGQVAHNSEAHLVGLRAVQMAVAEECAKVCLDHPQATAAYLVDAIRAIGRGDG